ncbi:MAG: acetyl-CoA C-acetyltransferase [Dehalococcoidia bacterium]|nr:acetyl-CoA C-acetyltransferase [Dehalococcoidia bacterium]
MATPEVVIVAGARTPMGKFMGGLSTVPATQLGAGAIRAALERARLAPQQVDYVIMGNVLMAGVGQAPARQAAIAAGIPDHISALTINKVCASGLTAVVLAAQMIKAGDAEVVVAGGMENMSLAPHMLVNSRTGIKLGDAKVVDHMVHDGLWCPFANRHMGGSAEAIAAKYGITREEQDRWALRSHQRAVAAAREGLFAAEIAPVTIKSRRGDTVVSADEGPRGDTSLEALAKLPPAFSEHGKTVTAGNASQITDGAAALVVMSAAKARQAGLEPMGVIQGYSHSAVDPQWLFDAPVAATETLLKKTGTRLDDYGLVEDNEAFCAQFLANSKVLGWDSERVNVKGGATALGHPIGASGARLLVTLLYAMKERRQRRGLVSICHGGGGAVAMALEGV